MLHHFHHVADAVVVDGAPLLLLPDEESQRDLHHHHHHGYEFGDLLMLVLDLAFVDYPHLLLHCHHHQGWNQCLLPDGYYYLVVDPYSSIEIPTHQQLL